MGDHVARAFCLKRIVANHIWFATQDWALCLVSTKHITPLANLSFGTSQDLLACCLNWIIALLRHYMLHCDIFGLMHITKIVYPHDLFVGCPYYPFPPGWVIYLKTGITALKWIFANTYRRTWTPRWRRRTKSLIPGWIPPWLVRPLTIQTRVTSLVVIDRARAPGTWATTRGEKFNVDAWWIERHKYNLSTL